MPLCGYLGLDELLADARLQSRMDQINARSWTIPIVEKAIGERNYRQLLEDFENLGIPFSPINKPSELFEDPHVLRDGGFVRSNMADGRTFWAPALLRN